MNVYVFANTMLILFCNVGNCFKTYFRYFDLCKQVIETHVVKTQNTSLVQFL